LTIVFASSAGLLSKVLSASIPTVSAGTTNLANRGHDPDLAAPKLIGITSFGVESSSLQHLASHVSATGGLIVIDCDSQPLISHLLFGASGIGATTIGLLKTGGGTICFGVVGLGVSAGLGVVGLGVVGFGFNLGAGVAGLGVGLGVGFGVGFGVVGFTFGWFMGGISFVM
jgi:hypothetical protein